MNEVKLRAGPAPLYVQRFGDPCTCGRPVMAGQGAVWFPYSYKYGPSERCGDCRRMGSLLCFYHRWERVLRTAEKRLRTDLSLDALCAPDSPRRAQWARVHQLVKDDIQEDIDEAKAEMKKARTHYRAFHYGCQVKEAVKDDGLRVRVIRLMKRRMGGQHVDMGKVRAAAAVSA